jgi:hypothetical protein
MPNVFAAFTTLCLLTIEEVFVEQVNVMRALTNCQRRGNDF